MSAIWTRLYFNGGRISSTPEYGVPAHYQINVHGLYGPHDVELRVPNFVYAAPGTIDPVCYQFRVTSVKISTSDVGFIEVESDSYGVTSDDDYTFIDLSHLMNTGWLHDGFSFSVLGSYESCNLPGRVTQLSPYDTYNHQIGGFLRHTWEYNGSLAINSYTFRVWHHYGLQIRSVDSVNVDASNTSLDYLWYFLDYGYYIWAVVANGTDGSTPDILHFGRKIYVRPIAPQALSPEGPLAPTNPVVFEWIAAPGATRYEILIEDGSGATIEQNYVDGTQYSRNFVDGGYFWRVRAASLGKNESFWTPRNPFTFVTGGEFTSPEAVRLEWDEVPGATLYQLQITAGGSFLYDPVVLSTSTAAPEFDWEGVGASGVYSWRVRPTDGSWSDPVTFVYHYSFMPYVYPHGLNANGITEQVPLGAIFNNPVEASSITPDSYLLVGGQSGAIPHSVNVSGQTEIQAVPTGNYRAGEHITVTMTSGITSTSAGDNLDPGRSFSFTTASRGNAEFHIETRIPLPDGRVNGSCLADLNDDGELDVVVALGTAKTISVVLSDGGGGYGPFTEYNAGPDMWKSYDTQGVVAADFDDDGDLDLASSNFNDGSISIYTNDGDGGFDDVSVFTMLDVANGAPGDIHAADIDNDGDMDIVCGSTQKVLVFENLGVSGFKLDVPGYATTGNAREICLGDMNSDGLIDVAAIDYTTGDLSILINSGYGTFGSPTSVEGVMNPTDLVSADINGDHHLDLAATSYSLSANQVRVFMNDGVGGFASYSDYTIPGDEFVSLAFIDANGDAQMDMVLGRAGDDTAPHDLALLLNDGAGQFGLPVLLDLVDEAGFTSFQPNALNVGDMDGDGTVDVVATKFGSPETVILYNLMVPGPVIQYSPVDGKVITNTAPVLDWLHILGFGVEYTVQLDEDANFTTPILREVTWAEDYWTVTPSLPEGTYHWRVQATNPAGVGPWSDVRSLTIDLPDPSCPVLYTYDGTGFVHENPLLTACEASGYRDVVTDYYLLPNAPTAENDELRFELRELEDEVTYLEELELLTVDTPLDVQVSCTTDGEIQLYRDRIEPLAAADQDGTDVLALIRDEDGQFFRAEEDGYLVIDYPSLAADGVFTTNGGSKPPCPPPDDPFGKVADGSTLVANSVTIEILNGQGEWEQIASLPSRQLSRLEAFGTGASAASEDKVSIRISWKGVFETDLVAQYIPLDQAPEVVRLTPSDYQLHVDAENPMATAVLGSGSKMELRKGDVLEFYFVAGEAPAKDAKRSYIIKAKGRYEPDYAVHTSMLPTRNVMHGNYPNPFNPSTTFKFDLAAEAHVTLTLFDVRGRLVRSLVTSDFMDAGAHAILWDGRDDSGRPISSGTYFYRFEAGAYKDSGRVLLVK